LLQATDINAIATTTGMSHFMRSSLKNLSRQGGRHLSISKKAYQKAGMLR